MLWQQPHYVKQGKRQCIKYKQGSHTRPTHTHLRVPLKLATEGYNGQQWTIMDTMDITDTTDTMDTMKNG